MKPYYEKDGIVIYHGDARSGTLSGDCFVTDPPWGVGLGEINNGTAGWKGQVSYNDFADSPEYVRDVVVPIIQELRESTKRGVVTPGNRNAFLYPNPDDLGVWWNPAGTGRGKWGFICASVILYYGKCPSPPNVISSSVQGLNDQVSAIKNITHPCPKPLQFTKWLVARASLEGETVVDPFCGSGTTLLACKQLGRKAIGWDLTEAYCEESAKRLDEQESFIFSEAGVA